MADKPHIFISYRRSDDLTMTGRIYDRLCSTFGENCVFKDMEDIPAGADFRQVLDNAVASADVVLVIIGQKWLSVTNASGGRRLDEPNDFVRAEIEAALNHAEVLLIPTLIDGAAMPSADQLPRSIQELAYRNAIMIRNDPDFSRDMQALNQNIQKHFTRPGSTKQTATRLSRVRLIGGIVTALLIVLVIAAGVALSRSGKSPSEVVASAPAILFANATATPVLIPAGKVLVLVAPLEPIRNPTPRDVSRFIVQDLNTVLDNSNANSVTLTRQHTTILKTSQEAQAAAKQTGAAVVVWGSYTDTDITLTLEVGALTAINALQLSRATLEQTVNVRLQLTDERTQSIAIPVLGVLMGTYAAAGESFPVSRTATLMSYFKPSDKIVVLGDTVAANIHRGFPLLFTAPATGIPYLDKALKDSPANSLIYALRTLFRLQMGDIENARNDAVAAGRTSDRWFLPPYLQAAISLSTNR